MSKMYLGVDIGGTAVKLGLVDENGQVVSGAERSVSFDGYKTPILDTVTIMLGTNDSKARFGCSSYLIALGITRLVKKALRTECWRDNAHPDVLVIVPPSITPEYDKLKFREEMGPGCHERCAGIAAQLEPMLKDLPGVRFLDANLLPGAGCSPVDGMHLTPEAHKAVAEALKNALTGVTL